MVVRKLAVPFAISKCKLYHLHGVIVNTCTLPSY